MCTSTFAVEDALRAQPATVAVLVTAAPGESGMATAVPLVTGAQVAPPTVSANVPVWSASGPSPLTVTELVPAEADAVVDKVIVDEPPEVTVAGLNVAVTPAGSPVAD